MTSHNELNIYFVALFATYRRCSFREDIGAWSGWNRNDASRDTWRSNRISEVTAHQTNRQRKLKKGAWWGKKNYESALT